MVEGWLNQWPEVHPGAFVHDAAIVIGDVVIGPRASVWPCAVLRGDMGRITVGEDSNIQDGAVCHNHPGRTALRLGARVTVGHRAVLHGCTVGDDCLIGMGAIVLDDAVIGAGCLIGAGALVPPGRVIPPGSRVLGAPGRVVGAVTISDAETIRVAWMSYVVLVEARRS